ncbi:TPA: hypothetical protein NJ057_000511 [Vibrio parahaemolyticus]|nr:MULTISPECIES: hypothetical protein [Vibrionaceae]EGQ7845300.1 hypothetical protein [Vibrio alginolyticus]EGQ8009174.1 hypothetical protein [Vibrio parahaemolyticus]EGQ8057972.1 hypothetical protein [Vibrio parahaemolyticus]EHH1247958.1 hypothetical protein [Vibrio parahaemolyticus]EHK2866607.1 hypothetical protein [Vibrio parahaemolyticus]
MTTVLTKIKEFVSVDSRWTDVFDKPIETSMRKHIYANDEITLFSGDHLPILLEQAILTEAITDEDYLRFVDLLEVEESFGYITLDATDGALVEDGNYSYEWFNGYSHTGTGGQFAAEFYFYANKKNYKSLYGCNIEGAMRYAFYRDECSGDGIFKKTWNPPLLDTTLHTGSDYIDFLKQQVDQYIRGLDMQTKLRSAMRTAGNGGGQRVTLSAAKERLENRKKRLAAKQAISN